MKYTCQPPENSLDELGIPKKGNNNNQTISIEFLVSLNIFQKHKGDSVKDTCIWNVKENVLSNTHKILKELELI